MTRTEHSGSPFRKVYAGVTRRVEFGDALLFFYALVFVRQYLWVINGNVLAWALAIPLAAACWYLYVSTKQFPAEKFGRSFWLLVGLPLLFAYLLRAVFPDRSYDVLTYHLLNAERTLRGTLFRSGDFFPTAFPFNPVADTVTGISRLLLGFRLGTIVNLFALVWAAQVTDKILRPLVGRAWLRSACVLMIILSETLLFEISTYMVDLLAIPLMIEATLLTLRFDEARSRRANFIHIALLLGASAAFKITNLAVALPVLLVCCYKIAVGPRRFAPKQLTTTLLLAIVAFIATSVPFAVYIYRLTGNPIFPVANVFFNSPYWPTHGGWDYRWGPQNFWETIVWPIMIWFKPERHSELALYSGRLSLGFIVAFIGLVLVWRNARARTISFILISSAFLWSATNTGYGRYGLYQEILAGLTVVAVASSLGTKTTWPKISWRTVLASVFIILLAIQSYFAGSYVLEKEWGSRPTIIDAPAAYARESRLILRDHSLNGFLTDEERALFGGVGVWLETCPKSTGFEVLLNPQPVVAARQPEFFFTRESWRQFISVVDEAVPKKMFSLCLNDDVPAAQQVLAQRGLEVAQITPIELPFFSRDRIGMMLIEVRRPQEPEALNEFESAWMKGAFPASAYREEIVALDSPSVMHPGEAAAIRFKVKNVGNAIWPAVGAKDSRYQVNLGCRWISSGADNDDSRTVMDSDLPPGAETQMTLTIHAPPTSGEYTLEVDLVHEGVTWFSQRGGRPLRLKMTVAP